MPSLLVVDDDRSIPHFVGALFRNTDITVHSAGTAAEALEKIRGERPDVILLDIVLPDGSGLELVSKIREIDERVPVVVITSTAESELAIEAMKVGAYDFLVKPLAAARVKELVAQAMEIRALMQTPVELPAESSETGSDHRLIGRSAAMLEVYKSIGRVAPQDVTVLIRGESGTGKELIARAI
jgi:two-component system nitrogen regulation response regulator GlnG